MSLNLYDITVPVYIHGLERLKEHLQIGEKWAEDESKDKEILLQGRLAPDMLVSHPRATAPPGLVSYRGGPLTSRSIAFDKPDPHSVRHVEEHYRTHWRR
jgi:hypothetical protein